MSGLLKLRLRARALSATYFSPLIGGRPVHAGAGFDDKSLAILRRAAKIRSRQDASRKR